MDFSQATLLFVVLAPGVVFAAFALLWLLGWVPSERVVSRITGLTFSACIFALAVIVWTLGSTGAPSVMVTFGNWFTVHDYHFPLVLLADRLSLPFLGLTVVLSGLIGQFSATYLHRERGFLRFFLLLHLFAFGSLLAFAAGSFDLLVAGWEMVGITSVLLIAFFQQRHRAGGKRSSRLRGVSCLRHRIAVGRVRHASLGRDSFVCRRPSRVNRNPDNHRLPAFAPCGRRKGGAGSVLGMASARDGGPHAIQRDLLWRDLDSRRRVSPAPCSTHARPVPTGLRFGDRHRRDHSRTRHHRRPGQRRCENFARLRVVDASGRGVRRDWTRLEMDRRRSHPGTCHGPHVAVPARAVDASRLSPNALRHRRRDLIHRNPSGGTASRNLFNCGSTAGRSTAATSIQFSIVL